MGMDECQPKTTNSFVGAIGLLIMSLCALLFYYYSWCWTVTTKGGKCVEGVGMDECQPKTTNSFVGEKALLIMSLCALLKKRNK